MNGNHYPHLIIESPAFADNGPIPKRYTGFGEDYSPPFKLTNLSPEAVSIAIIMDDLDIPMIKEFNHWIIGNIPNTELIPENIPAGPVVPALGNAVQGVGYGRNRYSGPKPPVFVRNKHRYIFKFYVLDCFLNLDANSIKSDLLNAMNGHIIQQGSLTGTYKR